jgi:Fibronectin type III domain
MVTTRFSVAFVFVGFIGAALSACGGSGGSSAGTSPSAATTSTSPSAATTSTPPSTGSTTPPSTATSAPATSATANVTWTPTAEDPSAAAPLAGYHIYYGTSADSMTQVVDVPGAGSVSYTIANLPPGTYYFGVTSYDTDKIESSMSEVVSVDLS